jgi:hypothetical protein
MPLEAGLWERAVPLDLDGVPVEAMSPEDTMMVVCTHAARSQWRQLEWVASVASIAARADLDWRLVAEIARRCAATRMLLLGLLLVRDLLDQPLPQPASALLAGDRSVARLAREMGRDLITGDLADGAHLTMRRLHHLRLCDRPRDRVRYLARFLLAPTITEKRLVRLPGWLEPLYPVLRLGRVVLGAARTLAASAAGRSR